MNEVVTYQSTLPDQPAELAKFIAFSQERAKALEAEIRAIKRLELAEEVYKLKQSELDQLRCQMLLAYKQMGGFTKSILTAPAGRPGKEILPSSGKNLDKSKGQVLQELGISTSQANRYEKIAAHPDVVEEVLSEAAAGQTEPTQAEVLRRIREQENGNVMSFADARKKRYDDDMSKIAEDGKNRKLFNKIVDLSAFHRLSDAVLDSLVNDEYPGVQCYIDLLSEAIQTLTDIRTKLILKGAKHGKKNHHAGN